MYILVQAKEVMCLPSRGQVGYAVLDCVAAGGAGAGLRVIMQAH